MYIRVTELGQGTQAPELRAEREIVRGTLTIGGAPPCDIVLPALGSSTPVAELRVGARGVEIARTGDLPVTVAGRELAPDSTSPLGPEVLVRVGSLDLVIAHGSSRGPGQPDSAAHPSAVARDLLKEVYAALGVPEEHPALVVYDADATVVKKIELDRPDAEVTIGRAPDNRLVLYHGSVSKRHARVVRDGLGFFVEDLGSKNGTYVRGTRIEGRTRLASGDRIRIGHFEIRFVDPKEIVASMADSVPDLQRIERAAPDERVRVGDSGADPLGATLAGAATGGFAPAAHAPELVEPARTGLLFWVLVLLGLCVLGAIGFLIVRSL